MKYYEHELLYASESGTAYFFVEILTTKIFAQIKELCAKMGFSDFLVHAYQSRITDDHVHKLEQRI